MNHKIQLKDIGIQGQKKIKEKEKVIREIEPKGNSGKPKDNLI